MREEDWLSGGERYKERNKASVKKNGREKNTIFLIRFGNRAFA